MHVTTVHDRAVKRVPVARDWSVWGHEQGDREVALQQVVRRTRDVDRESWPTGWTGTLPRTRLATATRSTTSTSRDKMGTGARPRSTAWPCHPRGVVLTPFLTAANVGPWPKTLFS